MLEKLLNTKGKLALSTIGATLATTYYHLDMFKLDLSNRFSFALQADNMRWWLDDLRMTYYRFWPLRSDDSIIKSLEQSYSQSWLNVEETPAKLAVGHESGYIRAYCDVPAGLEPGHYKVFLEDGSKGGACILERAGEAHAYLGDYPHPAIFAGALISIYLGLSFIKYVGIKRELSKIHAKTTENKAKENNK